MATIETFPITFIPADSATGTTFTPTNVPSGPSATSTAVASSLPGDASSVLESLMDDIADLKVASASLLIGLVIASITFGIVCTKAMTYFRGKGKGGALAVATVVSLVLLNVVQFIATVAVAYSSMIIEFGNRDSLLSTRWSVTIQVGLVGLVATIAHIYFAFRLHAVKRSTLLTMIILFFTLLQFAIGIVAVVQMAKLGFVNILLLTNGNIWAECTTYSIAAGINITIAATAYLWIQKPYVLQKYGHTTFMEEFQYWTIKSLFGTACLSIVNAVQSTIMDVDMVWLAGTFVLGNLYTLSILLTLESDRPTGHSATVISLASVHRSNTGSTGHRSSTGTLTNDDAALWEDIVKAQRMKAARGSLPKDSVTYTLGYEKDVAV